MSCRPRNISTLSYDIYNHILLFLRPLPDYLNVAAVSKSFHDLVFSEDISSVIWCQDILIICIEPTTGFSRYVNTCPDYRVNPILAKKLFRSCKILELEMHCFMDQLESSILDLSSKGTVTKLSIHLDRSRTGKVPFDVSLQINPRLFSALKHLSVKPAVDAKTPPSQIIHLSGCKEFLSSLGLYLISLTILGFTSTSGIFSVIQDTCPLLEELSIKVNDCKNISFHSPSLLSLYLCYRGITLEGAHLNLPSLHTFSCMIHIESDYGLLQSILAIPSQVKNLSVMGSAEYVNVMLLFISERFRALHSLDLKLFWVDTHDTDAVHISQHALSALASKQAELNTLYLPFQYAAADQSDTLQFSHFLKLERLGLWQHDDISLQCLAALLSKSPALKAVYVRGFGPDDSKVDWADLVTSG